MSMIKVKIICIFLNVKKGDFNKPYDCFFKIHIMELYYAAKPHLTLR